MPLQELNPNILSLKKSKGRCKESKPSNKENKVDGSVAVMRCCESASSSPMSVLVWNCRGLRSSLAVRLLTEEVRSKNPTLVFLVETKAQIN